MLQDENRISVLGQRRCRWEYCTFGGDIDDSQQSATDWEKGSHVVKQLYIQRPLSKFRVMSNLIRWPSLILAYLFLVLALVGIMVPGLPTVPFLLLTAWFAARGSERLHRWLYAHPHLGEILINWEQQGAVSRRSKHLAVLLLGISWGIMFWNAVNSWLLAGLALLFVAVAVFLVTRPEPR